MQIYSRSGMVGQDWPTVSVVIPAYRAEFLAQALASVQAQTYAASEVIVCDDSDDNAIEMIVGRFSETGLPCQYLRNDPPLRTMRSIQRGVNLARGEYVKILNDDDLLAPECIERMIPLLRDNPGIALVTSARIKIDERGAELPDSDKAYAMFREDVILHGGRLIRYMVERRVNFVGEPSTVMFRRNDVLGIMPHLMSVGGVEYRGLGDVGLWINLLSRGDAAYLSEPLSYFRLHDAQMQKDPVIRRASQQAWRALPAQLRRLGIAQGIWSPGLVYRRVGESVWRCAFGSRVGAVLRRGLNMVRDRLHGTDAKQSKNM